VEPVQTTGYKVIRLDFRMALPVNYEIFWLDLSGPTAVWEAGGGNGPADGALLVSEDGNWDICVSLIRCANH